MSDLEVETLMRRLDRLERGLRRWRILGGVAWTALAASIALMYVVAFHPVEPGSESSWTHDAFSGLVEGGFVWGRGAMDDKGALVAILEAAEMLIGGGFQPKPSTVVVWTRSLSV